MNDEGFTLVEVLVAFVILSLTVITSLSIYADNLSRISAIENRITSLEKARVAFGSGSTCTKINGARRSAIAAQAVDWTPYKVFACALQGSTGEKPIVTIFVEADTN